MAAIRVQITFRVGSLTVHSSSTGSLTLWLPTFILLVMNHHWWFRYHVFYLSKSAFWSSVCESIWLALAYPIGFSSHISRLSETNWIISSPLPIFVPDFTKNGHTSEKINKWHPDLNWQREHSFQKLMAKNMLGNWHTMNVTKWSRIREGFFLKSTKVRMYKLSGIIGRIGRSDCAL